jgi:hypothetical protein
MNSTRMLPTTVTLSPTAFPASFVNFCRTAVMRGTAAASHGPSGPSTITGIAIGGAGLIDPLPPLRDDDYLTFAKFLNSSGSIDRISLHKFKKGLLKYGIVYREEDAVTICLELNPSGGDVLVSSIRNKISNRDPKLCNLLKKYIRTVLENQPGSTRDRVLGKIISRAGETMTPEINLLRSSVSTYKYIESDAALLDIKDEVIEVVPVRSNIAAVEPNPSSASQRSSYLPETPSSRTSIHLPPHSSSRDRILGKIISSAVSTVSLEKSAHEDQPQLPQELTPRAAPHHSSRDKVLAKIISTAVSAAGGGSNNNGGDSSYHLSGEPSSSRLPVAQGKSSMGYAPLRGEDSKSSSFFPSSEVNSPTGGSGQDEGDCALQDYNDDLSVTRRSFASSQRTKNQTPQSPQESKGNCSSQRNSSGHDNGSGSNSSSESKRRVTYDPEKHSSLYSNPTNEFFQMDMMETAIDNRHILDRTLSRESNRPRRHSENSICEDQEVLEQMKSVRAKDLASRSQSKNLRTAVGYGAATGGGRVRNKILNRMVNRVKETVLPFSSSSEPNKHPNRPLSGHQSPQQPQREGHESPLKLKDKALSPTRDGTGSGRWFQHGGKFSATVAIDNFAAPPASPTSASSPRLCIQTMESRADGDISASASSHPGDLQQHSSREDRGSGSGRPRITSESPNPLRHILSDARLAIPSTSGSPQGSSSFSPGRGKASPLQLNVSTPQPYRETYRRTLHPHHTHSPEDRAFTPEPEAELLEDREERSSGWKSSDGNQTPGQRDRWVGAAPVQGGSGEHRSRQQQSSNRDSSGSSSRR